MENYIKVGEILIIKGADENRVLEPLILAGFKLCLIEPAEFGCRWIIMKENK